MWMSARENSSGPPLRRRWATWTAADGKLIWMAGNGELIVVAANPASYQELARPRSRCKGLVGARAGERPTVRPQQQGRHHLRGCPGNRSGELSGLELSAKPSGRRDSCRWPALARPVCKPAAGCAGLPWPPPKSLAAGPFEFPDRLSRSACGASLVGRRDESTEQRVRAVGLAQNSGWNCEATKNGCAGISMISTSWLSGVVPLMQNPAASNCAR